MIKKLHGGIAKKRAGNFNDTSCLPLLFSYFIKTNKIKSGKSPYLRSEKLFPFLFYSNFAFISNHKAIDGRSSGAIVYPYIPSDQALVNPASNIPNLAPL